MTSTSDLAMNPVAAEDQVKITADIEVAPYLVFSPDFIEYLEAAADHYLGSFFTNVEAFMADTPELSADRGHVALSETGDVVEFNVTFSLPESSDVAAAMRARDLLPGGGAYDYNDRAAVEAHERVDAAVAEHLRLMAKATGRLFIFGAGNTKWAS